MKAGRAVATTLAALDRVVVGQGSSWCLIGGMAVVARGVVRTTRDVDATIAGGVDLESFVAAAASEGLVPRIPDAVAFARTSQVLLLHHVSGSMSISPSPGSASSSKPWRARSGCSLAACAFPSPDPRT